MIRAFFLSVGQLGDKRIILVFLKSLALTGVILAAIGAGLWFGAQSLFTWFGASTSAAGLAGLAAAIGAVLAAWLLFRAIAIAVIGIFADEVVLAVEQKHYPQALAQAKDVPLGRSIAMGLGSAGRTLLYNAILSPAYLLLIVTGVGTPILFFAVNGWLLGRDLGDMVAARHMPAEAMKEWRGSTWASRYALGLIGTAVFVVPIVAILAPIIGAAMATHWFHGRVGFHQGRKT
ncbi:hypothetical protein G4G27_14590 [Sphingomonas sp. So64.6b]|uniref:EI24 domain-containing protein n=1 Tax=Sphingomonas sp. So64.6b TaxID=2997354 RepID=UPI0015FF44C7|nr:EI24 domain-containing protein [Sphingomonas sp. So64.6b]QNA85087.1 hypothetical protein G4G27_14590 [Sphingomonas sp. So64.6b]